LGTHTYLVKASHETKCWKRHIDQLLPAYRSKEPEVQAQEEKPRENRENETPSIPVFLPMSNGTRNNDVVQNETEIRRSVRVRKPPQRLDW